MTQSVTGGMPTQSVGTIKKAMSEAEKQRDRQLDQLTQRALALVHERRASGSVH